MRNIEYINDLSEAIDYVDNQIKIVKTYIADDTYIKMDLEFQKMKLLEKKFNLLCELREALKQ